MIQSIVATIKIKAGQDAPFEAIARELVAAVNVHRATEHYRTCGKAMGAHMDGAPVVLRMKELA